MPTWDADQYLRFAEERTQPCRDLAARIATSDPARVIDLGCGPGNSTAVLAARWPEAEIVGLDSSAEMIEKARGDFPAGRWMQGDLLRWQSDEPFDVVFSNAALQWVPEHAALLPRLLSQVAPGGVLAVQVPADPDALPHRRLRDLAATESWKSHFAQPVREWSVLAAGDYYGILAAHAARVELWTTDYIHVLPSVEAIAEWYRGTGMRPYLDALPGDEVRERFVQDFVASISADYPAQADGRVLFPFRRLFLLAHRQR